MVATQNFWRRCSNCKKEIPLGAKYSLCSVQSCTKVRSPVQFCSADCWAVHNEIENHKDAWAVEQVAPKVADANVAPPAKVSSSSAASAAPSASAAAADGGGEVLIVASRLKEFIKGASSGMSTSDQVLGPLSGHVRKMLDAGLASAAQHQRKTLLGRDIPKPAPGGNNDDVLVIVSRVKDYVRERSTDMRTSDEVPPVLSEELRRLSRVAIEQARRNGRKTVLGRDIP
ncbi:MAG TPA: hypothetical protein VGO62_16735 [Myxococcota bacterium]|jgi:hypothetical protein